MTAALLICCTFLFFLSRRNSVGTQGNKSTEQKAGTTSHLFWFEKVIRLAIFTARNGSSVGKVIFSEACVKNSVHRGVGACVARGVHGRRACVARGACMVGGMHGRGHA